MIIIKKKSAAFIISRDTCKKLAEHRLKTSVLDVHMWTFFRLNADVKISRIYWRPKHKISIGDIKIKQNGRALWYDELHKLLFTRFSKDHLNFLKYIISYL